MKEAVKNMGIEPIDYAGCYSGWHTLEMPNGKHTMFTSEEVVEVENG